ncbi:MAG TPA: hypothetical protein VGX78_11560, partial [Pirellulales bacterium]|nr:hypothetical protein [Pirellulales bacterium]
MSYPTQKRPSSAFVLLLFIATSQLSARIAEAQWVVVHGKNSAATESVPAEVGKTLADLRKRGVELKSLAFAPGGGWVVLYDKNGLIARNIPDEAFRTLTEQAKQG